MPFSYAKRIEPTLCTSIGEAMTVAAGITVAPEIVPLGSMSVSDDGRIQIFGRDIKYKITSHGMFSYCALLGIPSLFAAVIPEELLLHNIKRLTEERKEREVVVLFRDSETIASVVRPPYTEASLLDTLGIFAGRPEDSIKYIEVGERVTTIAFTFQQLLSPAFDKKDTFYVGCFVHMSLLKLLPLRMITGLYRTRCDNSFVMPFLGAVKAKYALKPETRLLRFQEQASSLLDTRLPARLEEVFSQSTRGVLMEHQWASIWQQLMFALSAHGADEIFGVDEDTRRVIVTNAQEYQREKKQARLLGLPHPEPTLTVTHAFDIANAITTLAKEYQENERVHLEKIGGSIFQRYVLNIN